MLDSGIDEIVDLVMNRGMEEPMRGKMMHEMERRGMEESEEPEEKEEPEEITPVKVELEIGAKPEGMEE